MSDDAPRLPRRDELAQMQIDAARVDVARMLLEERIAEETVIRRDSGRPLPGAALLNVADFASMRARVGADASLDYFLLNTAGGEVIVRWDAKVHQGEIRYLETPERARKMAIAASREAMTQSAATELERLAEQTDASLSGIEGAVAAHRRAVVAHLTHAVGCALAGCAGDCVTADTVAAAPRTVLIGPDHDAYAEFCAAAAALEAHQRASGAVMERYKTALQRLSERAAKAGA